MNDQQKLLVELARLGAEITRVSMNAIPAADKTGYARDLQEATNSINEKLANLRMQIATSRSKP